MNPKNFNWQKLEERPEVILAPRPSETNNSESDALFMKNYRQRDAEHSSQHRRSYELVIAIFISYTVLGFIVWQQTDQRISMLENEISRLQSQPQTISPPPFDETLTESKPPVIDNTLQFRGVKRQWHALARTIEIRKQAGNSIDPEGRLHRSFIDQHSMLQKLTINAVLIPPPSQLDLTYYQDAPSNLSFNTQHQTANLIIEFILAQHGDETIPALLDAFTKYEDWETLAPAVFDLSAAKFEAAWHGYLEETYAQNYNRFGEPSD